MKPTLKLFRTLKTQENINSNHSSDEQSHENVLISDKKALKKSMFKNPSHFNEILKILKENQEANKSNKVLNNLKLTLNQD